ncbi:MAG: AmpG family muropeptide MFS transporter [Pseudomonadales bacterium]
MTEQTQSWAETALIYCKPRVISMCLIGFGAGLPFLLVFSTLSAWLSDAGVSRSEIGLFAWVGITYSIKFIWSPVVDRLRLPLLGRLGQRRSWILLGQLGVAGGLIALAMVDPGADLTMVALCSVLIAFSSATQDVAVDAYRIDAVEPSLQGAMSASYIFGYRLALLVAGAGALLIADTYSWRMAYLSMAAIMMIAVITVLIVSEPERAGRPSDTSSATAMLDRWRHNIRTAVVEPFMDFFRRNGRLAWLILLFVAFYRLSDITMGIMANPFYLDLGFSKTEIAQVVKFFGFFMTIIGSFLCGGLVVRWGFYKPLLIGAIMVATTNLLFAALSQVGADIRWLAVVISADNLSGGIATTAFIAFLSSLTNRTYTATQYALFSSLMTLPGKFISGFSGFVVDDSGYTTFFVLAAILGIPAIVLVIVLMKRRDQIEANAASVH